MATTYWVPKCKWCGEVIEMMRGSKEGDFPPAKDPDVSLHCRNPICHDSPNRGHKFEWVRYK